MKILCFILILANLVLFLWEYRSGAFGASTTIVQAQEQLFLVDETKDSNNVKPNQ